MTSKSSTDYPLQLKIHTINQVMEMAYSIASFQSKVGLVWN